ncbi:hypothetical protein Rsub_13377, partial [Raphidocelis subcapitata]
RTRASTRPPPRCCAPRSRPRGWRPILTAPAGGCCAAPSSRRCGPPPVKGRAEEGPHARIQSVLGAECGGARCRRLRRLCGPAVDGGGGLRRQRRLHWRPQRRRPRREGEGCRGGGGAVAGRPRRSAAAGQWGAGGAAKGGRLAAAALCFGSTASAPPKTPFLGPSGGGCTGRRTAGRTSAVGPAGFVQANFGAMQRALAAITAALPDREGAWRSFTPERSPLASRCWRRRGGRRRCAASRSTRSAGGLSSSDVPLACMRSYCNQRLR